VIDPEFSRWDTKCTTGTVQIPITMIMRMPKKSLESNSAGRTASAMVISSSSPWNFVGD
jgi:hypothetical protein